MDLSILGKIAGDLFKIKFPKIPQADVLTFACDCDRYIEFEGKKYSPLISTFEDSLEEKGLSSVSISRINSLIKGNKAHGRVFSPDGAFARALVLKRIKQIFNKGSYSYSKYEEKIWLKILKQSQAKVVIGITPSRELCTACRKLGVWVADVQHGALSDSHSWYGVSFRGKDPEEWLPNAFLCWDSGAVDTINKWTNKFKIDLKLIGNPWVTRFKAAKSTDKLVNFMNKKYSLADNGKKNIFISLQWRGEGMGDDYIDPALEDYILKNIDVYNWYFRLHPNMIYGFAKSDGKRFFQYFYATYPAGKIDWKKATEIPLPLLLTKMDAHITWSSSVCIEAANFGVRSLLLHEKTLDGGEWEDVFRDLTELGYVDRMKGSYRALDEWFKTRIEKLKPLEDSSENYNAVINEIAMRARQ